MNPSSSKRGATSPAEGETSKKTDAKSTPTSPTGGLLGSFRRALGGGQQLPAVPVPNQTFNTLESGDDSEEVEYNDWSTGRTPGNTQPPKERQAPFKHPQVGPDPQFIHKHTVPCFEVKNDGAFRSEIEIEIQTINDKMGTNGIFESFVLRVCPCDHLMMLSNLIGQRVVDVFEKFLHF